MKNTISKDEFASALIQYCDDCSYSTLVERSYEIFNEGDTSYFITPLLDGRFAVWNDHELDVEYFNFYFEAEDAAIVDAAQDIEDKNKRFLFVLRALEGQLDRPHRDGHCEHAGHCEIIPILVDFLESQKGELSLNGFGDWYCNQSPSALFSEIVGRDFISTNWIHEAELLAWSQAVQNAGIEYAVVLPDQLLVY